MEEIFNTKIPNHFKTFILGKDDFLMGCLTKHLIRILVMAAKKNITRGRTDPEPPTISEWIDTVNEIYLMEKITYSFNLQMDKFTKMWEKWVSFMKNTQNNIWSASV